MEITGKRYAGNDWRKLLSTRRGTTVVALVCAAVAAIIIIFAMQRYRQGVTANGQPETVLVATKLIPKGTTAQAIASGGLFQSQQVVSKFVSAGAIADAAAIKGKVTTAEIYPGQQLTLADFAATGDLATQLGPGDRAMSIPLLQGAGLVGQLQAGDHVDVYATYSVTTPTLQGRTTAVTKLLVPNVAVLQAASTSSGGFSGTNLTNQASDVVLKVNDADAAKIAFTVGGSSNGSINGVIWLALRSANATTVPSATQLLTVNSILFGNKPIPAGFH